MDFSTTDIRMYSKLGQRGAFFGVALPKIVQNIDNIKLLTADLAILSGIERFQKTYPEKFLNVGIAEQNMIGIAAGLAMGGDVVFATTYSSFIAVRSLEHVRQHLSYLECNVKIVGTSAGVVAAKSGVSHWATEDIAFTRALPNLMVFSAADSLEAIKIAEYAAENAGPMYIRLSGGLNCPIVYDEDYKFEPGKMVKICEGKKVAILATGLMVHEAKKATELLAQKQIYATLYNVHTIKPIDKEELKKIFASYDLIVTVEEHNVIGGLGSAVAEYKALFSNTPRQVFIGIPDAFSQAGSQRYVWEQNNLTDYQIAERIIDEMEKEN